MASESWLREWGWEKAVEGGKDLVSKGGEA